VNAAELNWQSGTLYPEHLALFGSYGSTPGTTSGLNENPPKTPPLNVTFTGNPVRAWMIVLTFHPFFKPVRPSIEPFAERDIISSVQSEIMSNVLIAACMLQFRMVRILIIAKESDNIIRCVRPSVVRIEPQVPR
jgi:hypothetical protein